MKMKLFIGTIIVIFVLIGVSFTSIVGMSNIEPNSSMSPLFQIRRNGATMEENDEIGREYIGKQKGITIPLPTPIDKLEIIDRCNHILKRMDKKTCEKFFNIFTTHLNQNNAYREYGRKEISLFFNQLKNQEEKNPIPPTYFTCIGSEPFACVKDIMEMMVSLINSLIYLFILYFSSCLRTILPTIK